MTHKRGRPPKHREKAEAARVAWKAKADKAELLAGKAPVTLPEAVRAALPDVPERERDLAMGLFMARWVYWPDWSIRTYQKKTAARKAKKRGGGYNPDAATKKLFEILAIAGKLGVKDHLIKLLKDLPRGEVNVKFHTEFETEPNIKV